MIVCRTFSVVTVCFAVLAGAACSDRNRAQLPAETDEPYYVQGKQLIRQGRNPEALTLFLKVIDRRGERGAPESHLEAGSIYLKHTRDPVEAYHHFRKYLDLQPNSKEAVGVRGMVEDAKREFARTLPARPLDDQSLKMQADDAIEKLRRENEELRAQIATLRGTSAIPVTRAAPIITLPANVQPPAPSPPVATVVNSPNPPAHAPKTTAAPTTMFQTPVAPPPGTRTSAPTRPGASATRTHTVAPKDTLYGISMKYFGNGRQVDAIYQANRDQMRSKEDVRPGMTLRLPPADGAAAPRR
ncbi:MAG: LysM peptidoglycan-binding domain-containing protein [Opitutaceae bacterium]